MVYIYTYTIYMLSIYVPFHRIIFQTKILTSDILCLFKFYYSTVNFEQKLHDS